jgi:gamma-tubulin complex component 2
LLAFLPRLPFASRPRLTKTPRPSFSNR